MANLNEINPLPVVHPEQYYLPADQSVPENYDFWKIRKRADGDNVTHTRAAGAFNTANTLPTTLTLQNGLTSAGSDTVLRYWDFDGVNDYIGPTLSAGQHVQSAGGYGQVTVTGYDTNSFVFKVGDIVSIWMYSHEAETQYPIGLGNAAGDFGFGIVWNCGSTTGTLSVFDTGYPYETIAYEGLAKRKWVYLTLDSNDPGLFINGERAFFDAHGYGGAGQDKVAFGSGFGQLTEPQNLPLENFDVNDPPTSTSLHYLEIGRALHEAGGTKSGPGGPGPGAGPYNISNYEYSTTNFYVGEVQIWTHRETALSASIGTNTGMSRARYFHNISLSAGQLGYYHAQSV